MDANRPPLHGTRVLLVDDDQGFCEIVTRGLADHGYEVVWYTGAEQARKVLRKDHFDVAVVDIELGGPNGLELCTDILAVRPNLPVVVVTAFGSTDSAVGALRAGAYDFIVKPFGLEVLLRALERALSHRALHDEVHRLRQALAESTRFGELIGNSSAIKEVYDLLTRVSDSHATVLLTGESGTGKEVVARALHASGPRSAGPFVAVNCSALPETLLESELFGHARGAFTDARAEHPGLFTQASRGTLFLDEIGEMPLGLQPKILRALQQRTVRRVGGSAEIPFDVRLICATNRDLEQAVADRRFREDLYFRVNVVRIHLPPLRARGNDVLVLAQHFLDQFSAQTGRQFREITPAAAERLLAYPWPGNTRELQNCVERAVAIARSSEIGVEDLPERIRDYRGSHVLVASDDPSELASMEEVERRYIQRVFEAVGRNKTLAARILGFSRKTLYRKLGQYRIISEESKN